MEVHDMDRIYREHAHMVYKYLLAKTGDSGWAEELTQETFYRAVYSLETYNGECKVSTLSLIHISIYCVWYNPGPQNPRASRFHPPVSLSFP